MNSAPTGWLKANGAFISKTTYSRLFDALQSTYGETNEAGVSVTVGTGTHFRVPDLRGIFVRGSDSQTIGLKIYSGTLATKQADAVGPHTHSGTTGDDAPDHTHTTYTGKRDNSDPIWNGSTPAGNSNPIAKTAVPTTYQASGASLRHQHLFTTSSQSPASTTETHPANIALLYCIKF